MDLTERNDNLAYRSKKMTIDSLQIINHTADTTVKSMEKFNDKFTKNENLKQFLFRVSYKKAISI